jgi:hypothetical protein
MELQWTKGGIYRPVRNKHQGKVVYHSMNHTAAVNIWKQTNRVSRLWDELAENSVDPDPRSKEGISPGVEWKPYLSITSAPAPDNRLRFPLETGPSSFPGRWEESEMGERTLLERVGQESIHLIKHTLEVLTASPDENPLTNPEQEKELEGLPVISEEEEMKWAEALPAQAGPDLYPAMIKVPFEPEPQPTSTIETRRAVYGIKIPARPLHKRSIYARVFYCLRIWIRKASGKSCIP